MRRQHDRLLALCAVLPHRSLHVPPLSRREVTKATALCDEKSEAKMAKILIIDDDPDMVLAVRMSLEGTGHEVFDAGSGKEGLRKLEEVGPDLIILDVMMDTTTEGFQLALQLRSPDPGSPLAAYSHIPILMLTALHSTTDLRFGPDEDYLPVDAFVDKPIDPEELVSKVDALLANSQ
jgi:CheY-like chemotaxis protein